MPLQLSVAIVCRNNEATIGRTLESVRGLGAEIVAVDSGSVDGTIGLLEAAGARIIRSDWKGFFATKQLALDA
jgi:glycosyltransferase involved in cell wall biosynthesis